MQRSKRRRPRNTDSGADTLSQLLEREQRLAGEMEAAKEEAGRLLSDARTYAREKDAACDAMIRERTAQLEKAHQAQLEGDLGVIAANAMAEARRFDESDTALTRRLVAMVLESIGATASQDGVPSR